MHKYECISNVRFHGASMRAAVDADGLETTKSVCARVKAQNSRTECEEGSYRCALSDESIRFSCFALFHKRKRASATLFNWSA